MTGQTCALPGCFKPPFLRPGRNAPPVSLACCGNLHHLLLMASRCNPDAYLAILRRNNAGRCALLSCAEPPREGDSCCSRKHYLQWLTEFISSLHDPEYQICMFPGCTRLVYVDENGSASRFCGWRHVQEFVKLGARRHQQEPLRPSDTVVPPLQPPPPPFPAYSNESECGHLPSLDSQVRSLKQFAHVHFGTRPQDISLIEDFFEKHPWEVFTEGPHACWLIARPKLTHNRTRQLTTKDHYHWKQSGRPNKKNGGPVKYYTYVKRKGKEKEADQQHAKSLIFTMQEYTLDEDVESHLLIHLVKRSFDKRLGKEKPSKHQIADNVRLQDPVTSLSPLDDAMLVDILSNDLPPLDEDLHQDLHEYYGCGADPLGSCSNGTVDESRPMFGQGVAQAQVALPNMFTHGGSSSLFSFVFPSST